MPIVKHDCNKKSSPGYKYQTKIYGPGRVAANITKNGAYVCTICGKECGSAPTKKK